MSIASRAGFQVKCAFYRPAYAGTAHLVLARAIHGAELHEDFLSTEVELIWEENTLRDEFSAPIKRKLAERAGYICSNPSCNHLTIGPSRNNSSKSENVGKAAHICAASANGPRYDMSQSESQRSGILNGIWLCSNCADLVDKNAGIDYPAADLRRWKKDHEALIKNSLEANKRVVLQFLTPPPDQSVARKIVKFLENRGVLFVDYQNEFSPHVFESIKEIRIFLTGLQTAQVEDLEIDTVIDSINDGLRYYMNSTSASASEKELIYGLGAIRKHIGLNLRILEQRFNVNIPSNLEKLMPASDW